MAKIFAKWRKSEILILKFMGQKTYYLVGCDYEILNKTVYFGYLAGTQLFRALVKYLTARRGTCRSCFQRNSIVLVRMFGHFRRLAHMVTTNAHAS